MVSKPAQRAFEVGPERLDVLEPDAAGAGPPGRGRPPSGGGPRSRVDAAEARRVRDHARRVSTRRAASPSATSKESRPPKPGVAHALTAGARRAGARARARSPTGAGRGARASAGCAAGASAASGEATRRSRAELAQPRGGLLASGRRRAPSSTSWWPPRYFVALWRTTSAPCSSGRRRTGVDAVASHDDGRRVRGRRLEVGQRQERVRRRLEPDECRRPAARPSGRTRRRTAPSARARRRAGRAVVRALGERDRRARPSSASTTAVAAAMPDAKSSACRPRARRAPARLRRRSGARSARRRSRAGSPRRRRARWSSGRAACVHRLRR